MFPSSSLSRIDHSLRKATIISLAGNLPHSPGFNHATNQRHLRLVIPIHGRGTFTRRAILEKFKNKRGDGNHPEDVIFVTKMIHGFQ